MLRSQSTPWREREMSGTLVSDGRGPCIIFWLLPIRRLSSDENPRRLAAPMVLFVVIGGRLGHGFVLGLLHRLLQRHAAIGGLGEIAGAQAMGGIFRRVETSLFAT